MSRMWTDMLGRQVVLRGAPKRIISLVPSQTELLADLGLNEEVVGITKFCVHPEAWFRNKTRIGGTKKLNIERIRELNPDLIIANKEENEKAQVDELAAEFPVWISDIKDVSDALEMIRSVGNIVGKPHQASVLADKIEKGFAELTKTLESRRVAYFIWYRPWMTAGSDTFIHDMIQRIGWENVFGGLTRYPEVTLDELKELNPELVLLSSEPFPFKEKHVQEIAEQLPHATIKLVDGEMFSWYGSRMLHAVDYLTRLSASTGA